MSSKRAQLIENIAAISLQEDVHANSERSALPPAANPIENSSVPVAVDSSEANIGSLEATAKALWKQGELYELLSVLAKLIEINPYEPGYFALRAEAYKSMGMVTEALQDNHRLLHGFGSEWREKALDAIQELNEWQSELIASLIQEDLGFRVQYAQDPVAACASKGFVLSEEFVPGTWVKKDLSAFAVIRPS